MSRKGDCWDNAVVESFFGSLKQERVQWRNYQTRHEAQQDILEYISMFYNSNRLHSYLGYMSPNDFEKQLISDGFGDEIKKAIVSLDVYTNEKHREAKEQDRLTEIESYDDDKLYGVITGSKTQYGPAIAEQIIQSEKDLPPKVIALFGKISTILKIEEAEA